MDSSTSTPMKYCPSCGKKQKATDANVHDAKCPSCGNSMMVTTKDVLNTMDKATKNDNIPAPAKV